jgi:DUF4097 and DUF4098 domain-containing protein YvlB
MNRPYALLFAALLAAAAAPGPGAAAARKDHDDRPMTCDDNWSGGGRSNHCDIRETTIRDFGGKLDVEPGLNGGVSVRGSDRSDVLVRARVQTSADADAEAAELSGRVRIETAGGRVRAEGPPQADGASWSVSFQILVPRRTDVSVRTTNGGIALSGVHGDIDFRALNGGVALKGLGGNVRGNATNGGLAVVLTGDRWDGEALDVSTVNGGVNLSIPQNYSARLETGTEHGGVSFDYPMTITGKVEKQISTTIGSGGPLVRVVTTNGGVRLQRAE